MSKVPQSIRDRILLGIIGDEDTVTGILLAGAGHITTTKGSNFLVVDNKTPLQKIQEKFEELCKRPDVAIILINQHIANQIRPDIEEQIDGNPFPVVLEIPSKDHPYNPDKDSVLQRINKIYGKD